MLDEIISRQVPKLDESGPLAVGGPPSPQGPDAALLRHGEEGLPRVPVLVGRLIIIIAGMVSFKR